MTLGELPDIQAACIPDREAVADCGQNRRLTYRQLKEESDALAVSLIRLGIEKGDKAAVIMDNCWQNIVTKAAIEKIGAVIVNLNIHEKGEMLTALLRDADVKAVLIRQGIKAREHMDLATGGRIFSDAHRYFSVPLPGYMNDIVKRIKGKFAYAQDNA